MTTQLNNLALEIHVVDATQMLMLYIQTSSEQEVFSNHIVFAYYNV